MKILYLSPVGKKKQSNNDGDMKTYDFKNTSEIIISGIESNIADTHVTMLIDIIKENPELNNDRLNQYDIVLCDLTTMNPNITFHAGQADSLNKPTIYFRSNDAKHPVTLASKKILKYSEASIENEFLDQLCELIKVAKTDPNSLKESSRKTKKTPKAFISYSHNDRSYIARLQVHLRPLIKKGLIDIWVDTKIKTGDKWQDEIEKALSEANIAILMISADFMASDFIVDNELPPLLSKAEVQGTKILPVVVSPCRFARDPELSKFQAANSPTEPLSSMSEVDREKIYDQLANDIEVSIGDSYQA